RDPLVALPARRHAGQPDREPVPGRRHGAPNRVARLPRSHPPRVLPHRQPRRAADRAARRGQAPDPMSANAPTADLFRSEHMRRPTIVTKVVEGAATIAALLAVAVLVIVVGSVVKSGWGAINLDFFTKNQTLYSGFGPRPASGIANAIVGTLIIIGIALLMALPVGIMTAIYLNELAPRKLASVLTLAFDVLNGIPAIVLG